MPCGHFAISQFSWSSLSLPRTSLVVTVITDLESDDRKIMQELRDPHHYDILPSDPTESVINRS